MYVLKTIIEFALRVSRTKKGIHSNLGHLLWSLQSMGELPSTMKKGRHFLITNDNSFH